VIWSDAAEFKQGKMPTQIGNDAATQHLTYDAAGQPATATSDRWAASRPNGRTYKWDLHRD